MKLNSKKIRLLVGIILIVLMGTQYLNNIQKIKETFVVTSEIYATNVLNGGTLPSTITSDTLLTSGTYTINSSLTVAAGVTLEVEAGTVINLANTSSLIVNGTLLYKWFIKEKNN